MAKAIALVRARTVSLDDPAELARAGIVLFCGLALIAAGPALPTLL